MEAGRRDYDHRGDGRGRRYEQHAEHHRRRHIQHHPDDRYLHHRGRRPESHRRRTPPSSERYVHHSQQQQQQQQQQQHHERKEWHAEDRRAGPRSTSPRSRSADRQDTSRKRRRRCQPRSRSSHRGRRRDSFPHRGHRDDNEYREHDEHYYDHSYQYPPDRGSERQKSTGRRTSRQKRRRRRRESSSDSDERSCSSSPSPPPLPPRPPAFHPAPNEAPLLPRAGVVSDDEEHHHHHHAATATTTKPTAASAAAAAAVARLPDTSPPNNSDHDNNSNLRSPSFHDDSVGHFRGGRGTLIADRYRIIRDVGFGTFGRVVECLDLESRRRHSHRQERQRRQSSTTSSSLSAAAEMYVAIKIVRKVKRYNESAQIEARIVQDVNRRGGRGITHCAILHDAFTFSGHFCMVFENLGLSLYDFLKRNKYQPFPMACIQDFTVQLLQTLEFLHSFRLIHTDLKIENILLVNDRETTYGHSRVPESTHIKVIDFGGACYDDAKKSSVINTRQYRAPEVMLGMGWSMPSDIFSLGCILAELYQGELLFPTHNNIEHLALMEHVIGPFPFSIIQTAKNSSELANQAFDSSSGRHVMERILSAESTSFVKKSSRLESIIRNPHDDWFLQLLRRMLVVDPEARATAHECLRYLSTIRRDVVRHA